MGKPSVVRMRASDSPSSRPPSRRCTDTFTRVPCLGSARCMAVGGGVAVPVESASPLAGCVVSTSLMARRSLAMIAPGHRHEIGPDLVAAAFLVLDPPALPVDQVVKGGHRCVEALGDLVGDVLCKLRLGEHHEVVAADVTREVPSRRVLLQDLEDDRRESLDHVVAANESVVVVVALEGVDVGVKDREALLADETDCYLTKDV